MSEESFSTASHLSVAMTTTETDEVQTTGGSGMASSSSLGVEFYFQCAMLVIGVVGTAANSLIIYAMIVSDQHKKQLLIFNQNIFDLCSSLLLIVTFTLKLCNLYLTGAVGYWLCMLLVSENLLWCSINGSQMNLLSITIERYLQVVHHKWSKKVLRKWVKISAAAFAWISGIVYDMAEATKSSSLDSSRVSSYSNLCSNDCRVMVRVRVRSKFHREVIPANIVLQIKFNWYILSQKNFIE